MTFREVRETNGAKTYYEWKESGQQVFFRAEVDRILWEVVQRSQESWLWKKPLRSTIVHPNEQDRANGHQEGSAWLNREMPSSHVRRGCRKGGSRDGLSGKMIKTLWEHDRGKDGWNWCEKQKRSKGTWIVMTLWTYTSSRDSPHTEFLLHSLLCQPCTNNTEMDGIISVGK